MRSCVARYSSRVHLPLLIAFCAARYKQLMQETHYGTCSPHRNAVGFQEAHINVTFTSVKFFEATHWGFKNILIRAKYK